jgi:hypothetical protein
MAITIYHTTATSTAPVLMVTCILKQPVLHDELHERNVDSRHGKTRAIRRGFVPPPVCQKLFTQIAAKIFSSSSWNRSLSKQSTRKESVQTRAQRETTRCNIERSTWHAFLCFRPAFNQKYTRAHATKSIRIAMPLRK